MTITYRVGLGWNPVELEYAEVRAKDFPDALAAARHGWGRAWTCVLVTDPATGETIDVAVKNTDPKDLTPEQWVTRRLAAPVEVAIVSIDAFLAALRPQIVGFPGPTNNRPVWVVLDGMLYAPAQIGLDAEFGGIMIVPAPSPSGTAGLVAGGTS